MDCVPTRSAQGLHVPHMPFPTTKIDVMMCWKLEDFIVVPSQNFSHHAILAMKCSESCCHLLSRFFEVKAMLPLLHHWILYGCWMLLGCCKMLWDDHYKNLRHRFHNPPWDSICRWENVWNLKQSFGSIPNINQTWRDMKRTSNLWPKTTWARREGNPFHSTLRLLRQHFIDDALAGVRETIKNSKAMLQVKWCQKC